MLESEEIPTDDQIIEVNQAAREEVVVEMTDVFTEGATIKPIDKEGKEVLHRLHEVFSRKAKEIVPSLKTRNQVEVKKHLRLVNGVTGT